jgi:hypothetical protein
MENRTANKHTFVPARLLRVHPEAQRKFQPAWAKKLAEKLDLDALGMFHAVESVINGVRGLWIIDGQHRLAALMQHKLGDWEVMCEIHVGVKDVKTACEKFLNLNSSKKPSAFETFDKAAKAGHSIEVGVTQIVSRYGLRVSDQSDNGTIACVSALCRVYGLDGGHSLDTALRLATTAWGRESSAVEGRLIAALTTFVHASNGTFNEESLRKKLMKYPGGPGKILASGRLFADAKRKTVEYGIVEVLDGLNERRR